MVSVLLKNLSKVFSDPDSKNKEIVAVDHIDLEISQGELVTFLGPSGCGKTTTLRMVAGFENPSEGEIYISGTPVTTIPPNRRDTAMVFQSYAIFPHLNVGDNVGFGLRLKGLPKAEIDKRVEEMLALVGLDGLARRSPAQLSGGQQQRVALARAIINEPKVLLFDEPLSNLDAKLREQMRVEIRSIQKRLGITSIYVTHDQTEAMALSDRIVIMNKGRIEQIGTPTQIYQYPQNRFVADFIGRVNLLEGLVEEWTDSHLVAKVGESMLKIALNGNYPRTGQVLIALRPETVFPLSSSTTKRPDDDASYYTGVVKRTTFYGSYVEYLLELFGQQVISVVNNPLESGIIPEGAQVEVRIGKMAARLLAG